jgi:hypothetical protein
LQLAAHGTTRGGATWTGYFKCREVKTGFCRNRSMQTGSSGTLIGWKSGQTTFVSIWDRREGAWLRTQGLYSETGFHNGMERKFVCSWRRPNCISQVTLFLQILFQLCRAPYSYQALFQPVQCVHLSLSLFQLPLVHLIPSSLNSF